MQFVPLFCNGQTVVHEFTHVVRSAVVSIETGTGQMSLFKDAWKKSKKAVC